MKIVALNTSETSASVALVEDSRLVCEEFFSSRVTHSRVIMEMIDLVLTTRAGLPLSKIDGFVAARGPGSFTGLRIGISVVKGLAYAASKPVAGISSLDAIAWQVSTSEKTVCALMDAKRGEVYTACYRFSKGRMIHKSDEVCATPEKAVALAGGSALYVGSGAVAYRREIDALDPGQASFAPLFQNPVRASALAHALFQAPDLLSKDPLSLLPVYIRRSDAEINYDRHPDRFC